MCKAALRLCTYKDLDVYILFVQLYYTTNFSGHVLLTNGFHPPGQCPVQAGTPEPARLITARNLGQKDKQKSRSFMCPWELPGILLVESPAGWSLPSLGPNSTSTWSCAFISKGDAARPDLPLAHPLSFGGFPPCSKPAASLKSRQTAVDRYKQHGN